MHIKGSLFLAAGAAATFAAAPAHAEKGKIEVNGFFGWHIVTDQNDLGEPANDRELVDDAGIFGLRVGYYLLDKLTVEGELGIMPTDATGDDDDDTTAFAYRVHLGWDLARIPDLGGTLSLLVGGGGMTVSESDNGAIGSGTIFAPDLGLAAKVKLGENWGLRFDGRAILVPGHDADFGDDGPFDWEATIGVYRFFGGAPAPKKEEPVVEPPKDSDGDGLTDDTDKCPSEAEDKDGFEDTDGCPDADNDGDGVPDASDKAPNEAEDKDGFEDEDGAPEADNDGDGFADADDKCPNDAEDKDNFADDDGCPDLDNDNDGVADAQDQCPDQLEVKNGYLDTDGCADELPKEVAKYTGTIKGINFETKKATITKPSFKVLDEAVKVLTQYPDLKLEVQGHTDDVGDDAFNMTLSQERADAVKAYLVGKGVGEDRIKSVGYGETKPVDPAKNAKARAKNRRVEFQLIAQ